MFWVRSITVVASVLYSALSLSADFRIIGYNYPEVGVFNKEGVFLNTISIDELPSKPAVLKDNTKLGFVLISKKSGDDIWLNKADLKMVSLKEPAVCASGASGTNTKNRGALGAGEDC